jgi:hypothetical protein
LGVGSEKGANVRGLAPTDTPTHRTRCRRMAVLPELIRMLELGLKVAHQVIFFPDKKSN